MRDLKIYQIYFDDESKKNCIDHEDVIQYHNDELPRPLYENKVISQLVPLEDECKRIGVFSHKYSSKIGVGIDAIKHRDEDIITFFKISKGDYWGNFEKWHKGGLRALMILNKKHGWGIDFRVNPSTIVYQNHFVAESNIYKKYVHNFLNPVIKDILNPNNEELYELVNRKTLIQRYVNETMHTFLLERLFSVFLTVNTYRTHQFNILYLN